MTRFIQPTEEQLKAKKQDGLIFTLSEDLVALPELRRATYGEMSNIESFIYRRLKKTYEAERFQLVSSNIDLENSFQLQRGFVGLLAVAYSSHKPVQIYPHDLWYIVLSELALIVNKHPDKCRSLFTHSEEKIKIMISTDDVTKLDLTALIDKLGQLMPTNIETLVPTLSSTTQDALIAMYAALADAAQVYYDYMTYLCGIPAIMVAGSLEDWDKLIKCCREIKAKFSEIDLPLVVDWLSKVENILIKIHQSVIDGATEESIEFWKDIFRSQNVGSGTNLMIDGWITELFYTKHKTPKIENFTAALSLIPYTNIETKRNFVAVYGGFEVRSTDKGFLKTGYSNFIFEKFE